MSERARTWCRGLGLLQPIQQVCQLRIVEFFHRPGQFARPGVWERRTHGDRAGVGGVGGGVQRWVKDVWGRLEAQNSAQKCEQAAAGWPLLNLCPPLTAHHALIAATH